MITSVSSGRRLEDMPLQLADLREQIKNSNAGQAGVRAHTIRSAAANIREVVA
jgi:hypothetical protein